ncbi:hypothetical protein HanOQP8_Chr13g0501681 [Helianthus annuus]|nr:hypothetical protein HanOQP8_Chr13g0501681 [Helianthus annuus]
MPYLGQSGVGGSMAGYGAENPDDWSIRMEVLVVQEKHCAPELAGL